MQTVATKEQAAELSIAELVEQTMATTSELAQKQIELLRAELTEAIATEKRRAIELGVGVLCAFLGLVMLLFAAVLGLGRVFGHPELFALGLGVACAIAGAALIPVSLRKQDEVLASSRRIAEEEITWAKQQVSETKLLTSPKT